MLKPPNSKSVAAYVLLFCAISEILVYRSQSRINSSKSQPHVPPPKPYHSSSKPFHFAPKCKKNPNIVYVKTHKTGSTSLMNILGKYSGAKGIRVKGFPSSKYGGYPAPFNASFVSYKPRNKSMGSIAFKEGSEKPNYLFGHMKFNYKEVKRLMPANTKYVTIVRNPINQIPSTFNYYYTMRTGSCSLFGCHCSPFVELFNGSRNNTLEDFLEMPLHYANKTVPLSFKARNFQAFDLGLDSLNTDPEYIRQETRRLDKIFDLVLVTEYLEESLILMKDVLCMTTTDILYNFKNTKKYEKPIYNDKVLSNMRKFYHQDFYIYDYFNRTLWAKIDKFGRSRMEKELDKLRKLEYTHLEEQNAKRQRRQAKKRWDIKPYTYEPEDAHLFKNLQSKEDEILMRLKYDRRTRADMENMPIGFDVDEYVRYVAKYYNICKIVER